MPALEVPLAGPACLELRVEEPPELGERGARRDRVERRQVLGRFEDRLPLLGGGQKPAREAGDGVRHLAPGRFPGEPIEGLRQARIQSSKAVTLFDETRVGWRPDLGVLHSAGFRSPEGEGPRQPIQALVPGLPSGHDTGHATEQVPVGGDGGGSRGPIAGWPRDLSMDPRPQIDERASFTPTRPLHYPVPVTLYLV